MDECHHSRQRHPYNVIMKEFYFNLSDTEKPLIFGMTASPFTKKMSVKDSIRLLECSLDAKAVTVSHEHDTDLQKYSIPAVESIVFYSSFSWVDNIGMFDHLEGICHANGDDTCSNVLRIINKARYVSQELGSWAGYSFLKSELRGLYEKAFNLVEKYDEFDDDEMENDHVSIFQKQYIATLYESSLSFDSPELSENTVSLKFLRLLKIIQKFIPEDDSAFSCMIFVERRVTAKLLRELLECYDKVGSLLRPGILVGHNSVEFLKNSASSFSNFNSKSQRKVVRDFHSGVINTLISTSIGEEGLDIPSCSLVIRFNPCQSWISYVQSRGRARKKESNFIMMCDENSSKDLALMESLTRQNEEVSYLKQKGSWSLVEGMENLAVDDDDDDEILIDEQENEMFKVDETEALVSFNSSIPIIHRYCAQLAVSAEYTPKPEFVLLTQFTQTYICEVFLPASGTINYARGKVMRSKTLAKRSACLEACKLLHLHGGLDSHLISVFQKESKPRKTGICNDMKKLLAGMNISEDDIPDENIVADYSWIPSMNWKFESAENESEEVTLNLYALNFEKHKDSSVTIDLGLIMRSKVGWFTGFPLYIPSNSKDEGYQKINVSVKETEIKLSKFQLGRLKRITSYIMRYYLLSNRDGVDLTGNSPQYIYDKVDFDSWDENYGYFVCPIENGTANIDWSKISYLETAEKMFRESETGEFYPIYQALVQKYGKNNMPQEFLVTDVVDYQRRVIIHELLDHMGCKSIFEVDANGQEITYEDLYRKNHRRIPYTKNFLGDIDPSQPLCRISRIPPFRSFLKPPEFVAKDYGKEKEHPSKLPSNRIAKFLIFNPIPAEFMYSLVVLPSVTYLFEAFENVARFQNSAPVLKEISNMYLLEALTAPTSSAGYNYERLETLGDSVLKIIITLHLYMTHSDKMEGQLSYTRHILVSNKALFNRARKKNLHEYVWIDTLSPRDWRIPRSTDSKGTRLCLMGSKKSNQESLKTLYESEVVITDWMVADVVESILGSAFLTGGINLSLRCAEYFGILVGEIEIWSDLIPKLDTLLMKNEKSIEENAKRLNERRSFPVLYEEMERLLGYKFSNRSLLEEALNHQSSPYNYLKSYERLEHLGDAVLDFHVVNRLFKINNFRKSNDFPPFVPVCANMEDAERQKLDIARLPLDPGKLTELKSLIVSNDTLAFASSASGLYKHVMIFSDPLTKSFCKFRNWVEIICEQKMIRETVSSKTLPWWWWITDTSVKPRMKLTQCTLEMVKETLCLDFVKMYISGKFSIAPPQTPKVISDVTEAVIGAVFLDSRFDLATSGHVIERLLCLQGRRPRPKTETTIIPTEILIPDDTIAAQDVVNFEKWVVEHFEEAIYGRANPIKKILMWADAVQCEIVEHQFPWQSTEKWFNETCEIEAEELLDIDIPSYVYSLEDAKKITQSNTELRNPVTGYYLDGILLGVGIGESLKTARLMAAQMTINTIQVACCERLRNITQ